MIKITKVTIADVNNQIVRVEGGSGIYRREPCPGCPWKVQNDGLFPAEAFRISANTAHDMAQETFGCHESGSKKPATCAGFLLRNSEHNMAVRLAIMRGTYLNDVSDGGHVLHGNYRAMAIANGVPNDDPSLKECRP